MHTSFRLLKPSLASAGSRRAAGLTLLELVVVLMILATLGTAIVTSTAGLGDQARFEQSARTLEAIEDAILGRSPQRDEVPSSVRAGFVADIGRLPQPGPTGEGDLSELWDRHTASPAPTTALPPFQLWPLTGLDSELVLASGWRGPYVRLPMGARQLRDGWGQPLALLGPEGAPASGPGDPIAQVQAEGSGTGDAFDQRLAVVLVDRVSSDPLQHLDRAHEPRSLQLAFHLPPGQMAVVRVYGPIAGRPAVIAQRAVPGTGAVASAAIALDQLHPDLAAEAQGRLPLGPKLVRAYAWPSNPGFTDDLSAAALKSRAILVTVSPGGGAWPELKLGAVED